MTTRDSHLTILVEVFTNHVLAENIFHESFRVKRTPDYGLKTCKLMPDYSAMPYAENIFIDDFLHHPILYRVKVS